MIGFDFRKNYVKWIDFATYYIEIDSTEYSLKCYLKIFHLKAFFCFSITSCNNFTKKLSAFTVSLFLAKKPLISRKMLILYMISGKWTYFSDLKINSTCHKFVEKLSVSRKIINPGPCWGKNSEEIHKLY